MIWKIPAESFDRSQQAQRSVTTDDQTKPSTMGLGSRPALSTHMQTGAQVAATKPFRCPFLMSFIGIQGPPSTSEKWLHLISLVLKEKTIGGGFFALDAWAPTKSDAVTHQISRVPEINQSVCLSQTHTLTMPLPHTSLSPYL